MNKNKLLHIQKYSLTMGENRPDSVSESLRLELYLFPKYPEEGLIKDTLRPFESS